LRQLLGRAGCKMTLNNHVREGLFTLCAVPPDHSDALCKEYPRVPPQKTQFTGVALNPRFSDRVDWRRIAYPNTKFVLLRRTNLLRMALSKVDHGGCRPYRQPKSTEHVLFPSFFEQCIRVYALLEQESGTSTALRASVSMIAEENLFILLYEDVMKEGKALEEKLYEFLGMNVEKKAALNALHAHEVQDHPEADLCRDKRIVCRKENFFELDRGVIYKDEEEPTEEVFTGYLDRWSEDAYPCLRKMLLSKDKSVPYSVPMLSNKTGMCVCVCVCVRECVVLIIIYGSGLIQT
jgi:hypothetical protein